MVPINPVNATILKQICSYFLEIGRKNIFPILELNWYNHPFLRPQKRAISKPLVTAKKISLYPKI